MTKPHRTIYKGKTTLKFHYEKYKMNITMKWDNTTYRINAVSKCEDRNNGRCRIPEYPFRFSNYDQKFVFRLLDGEKIEDLMVEVKEMERERKIKTHSRYRMQKAREAEYEDNQVDQDKILSELNKKK